MEFSILLVSETDVLTISLNSVKARSHVADSSLLCWGGEWSPLVLFASRLSSGGTRIAKIVASEIFYMSKIH